MYEIKNELTNEQEQELRRVALKKWNEGGSMTREAGSN